jgi:7,8-dihydropterin-6-yl-methyl-4-(beta-D-ribofuranosyl)aminobenzene 5'-phosphate synthase
MEILNRREAIKKSGRIALSAAGLISLSPFASSCSNDTQAIETGVDLRRKIEPADIQRIKITVIYDNNPYNEQLKIDWGFSCLVEGLDQTVLFDTGRYASVFLANAAKLGIDLKTIDSMVLSHEHPDHMGGMTAFLKIKSDIPVFLPQSFSSGTKKEAEQLGANIIEVEHPVIISKNCISTGQMKNFVKNEHSLIIDTTQGVIIITGCAHPGVVDITGRVQEIMQKEILLVLGGFHLLNHDEGSIRKIISQFKSARVRYVAATHCSGPEARTLFAAAYNKNYIECGAGRMLTAKDFA